MPLGLSLLVLSQLPLLAAFVLAFPGSTSEHEVTSSLDHGVVHLTLHHQNAPSCAHRHHGCERLFLGASEGEHQDHEISAGSGQVSVKPTEGVDLPEDCFNTVWVDLFEHLSVESAVLAYSRGRQANSFGPPSTPVALRRGIVMRH